MPELPPYNAAFFGLYETLFETEGINAFRRVIRAALKKSYDRARFKKGVPHEFVRVVGERDSSVGLHVEFPKVTEDKIVYRFHTDPFPNLQGKVSPRTLDATYMEFKVSYLLGEEWTYKTTKHLWRGDDCTEHIITKRREATIIPQKRRVAASATV
ncbi:MAG: hypothetical protein HYW25_04135 [Candidatus Aenigmarchaeota archaeon]|nr:hypothetical protein [Candidatus Aenigmarchaeota archaeon]